MKPKITALVGMCGTGKSEAAKHIEETYKYKPIYFGGFVLEEVKNRNLEINSVNEKNVREDLRALHGIEVMAKLAKDKIQKNLQEDFYTIIDGLYSFSEYTYLKEIFADQLMIIAIHSSKQLRYKRLGIRKVRPLTPEQVDQRDYNEIKNIEKAGPIAIADHHILNNGTLQDLKRQIDQIFHAARGL